MYLFFRNVCLHTRKLLIFRLFYFPIISIYIHTHSYIETTEGNGIYVNNNPRPQIDLGFNEPHLFNWDLSRWCSVGGRAMCRAVSLLCVAASDVVTATVGPACLFKFLVRFAVCVVRSRGDVRKLTNCHTAYEVEFNMDLLIFACVKLYYPTLFKKKHKEPDRRYSDSAYLFTSEYLKINSLYVI